MTTLHQLSTCCAAAAVAIAAAVGASSPARAQSQSDFAEMAAALKRLEGRVAALEGENKQVKREAATARAEAQALRQRLGAAAPHSTQVAARSVTAAPAAPALPSETYAMATKAPLLPPPPSWSGFYAGAAFGMGWMRGQETELENEVINSVSSGPGFAQVQSETNVTTSMLDSRNVGAIANLYLGYNFLVTPTVVLGAQVEGGVANIRVNLRGPSTNTMTLTTVLPPGGAANTSSSVSISPSNISEPLDNRWMVSILGRGGVLVDPLDYLYLLGGYTYGRFETTGSPHAFGLNGGTVGAGWERQIAAGWSLRGEYRYTKFQSRDFSFNSVNTLSSTNFDGTGAVVGTSTSVDSITGTNHVSADMHSLWVGVTHYFGP